MQNQTNAVLNCEEAYSVGDILPSVILQHWRSVANKITLFGPRYLQGDAYDWGAIIQWLRSISTALSGPVYVPYREETWGRGRARHCLAFPFRPAIQDEDYPKKENRCFLLVI